MWKLDLELSYEEGLKASESGSSNDTEISRTVRGINEATMARAGYQRSLLKTNKKRQMKFVGYTCGRGMILKRHFCVIKWKEK